MSVATKAAFDPTEYLRTVTSQPGVYRMLNGRGEVLYVGKAKNLKKRLSSYFADRARLPAKTRALVKHTRAVEVTVTDTEGEALLLESNLIKASRPRYNIVLRDDKSYPYIYVSANEGFPRLAFHRGSKKAKGRYFGPYPSAGAVRETLNQLQKLFLVRQCDNSFFRSRTRPCLQYQIHRCTAPCVDLVKEETYQDDVRHALLFLESKSEAAVAALTERMEAASDRLDFELAARYRNQIARLRRVQERQRVSGLRGDADIIAAACGGGAALVQIFSVRDGQSLGNKSFEPRHAAGAGAPELLGAFLAQYYLAASEQRPIPPEIMVSEALQEADLLSTVLSQRAGGRVRLIHPIRGERMRWMRMALANAEAALGQRLASESAWRRRLDNLREALGLGEIPRRIECFDVSHTAGEATVASCVVFGLAGPMRSHYRRFNVAGVAPGDDYAALRQALGRRYRRVQREEGELPDVLLVDGGKGQLAQAEAVLEELQLGGVTVLAIAKGPSRKAGFETLFVAAEGEQLTPPADSAALHIIQQIRDEAHRFAIAGHRSRRAKSRTKSALEEIPGIGNKRRQQLLREFGGLQGVAGAGAEDLARIKGISRALAEQIYQFFRGGA